MSLRNIVDDMLFTSYERAGRGPYKFDCWGMVIEVCKRASWSVPVDPIVASANPREMLGYFKDHMKPECWRRCKPQDGAVAFFGKMIAARHAGILIEGGILHTIEGIGPRWQILSDFEGQKLEFALWVG